MNNKIRTKGGTVQVVADIQKGIIRDIRFYGDFFSEKDPQDLVSQLIGIKFDKESISNILKNINLYKYFNNVSPEEINQLLTP